LPEQAEDPERVAIREALAFGKAVYDQRRTWVSASHLGLSVADLARRAGMSADEIECIEEGGTEPTIALLRRLAAALAADVHLTAGHDLGSVWFDPHAADREALLYWPPAAALTDCDARCGHGAISAIWPATCLLRWPCDATPNRVTCGPSTP